MANPKLPGILKRLATGPNSARRTKRPVQNITGHYTKRFQAALNQARIEAERNNSNEIGIVHLLLAITHDATDLTTQFLANNQINNLFLLSTLPPPSTLRTPPASDPGPDLQKVIELAAAIALRLNHPYIGTEHLLLGILEQETALTRICQGLTLNIPELKQKFNELLQKPQYQPFAYISSQK